MRKILRTVILFSFVFFSCATIDRGNPEKIFESHDSTQGVVYLSLPPNLAKKYIKTEFESNKEVKETLEEIEVMKALSIKKDEAEIDVDTEIVEPLKAYALKEDMKELINVTNKNFHVSIQISESGEGKIDELLFMIDSKENYTGVFLKGNITLENILAIIRHVDFNEIGNSFSFDIGI